MSKLMQKYVTPCNICQQLFYEIASANENYHKCLINLVYASYITGILMFKFFTMMFGALVLLAFFGLISIGFKLFGRKS